MQLTETVDGKFKLFLQMQILQLSVFNFKATIQLIFIYYALWYIFFIENTIFKVQFLTTEKF